MCDPISIAAASFAVSAISTGVQYDSTRRAANQQADAIRANTSANDAALQLQQGQIAEQTTQQMSQRAVEAMRERGRLTAALGGMGGTTADRVLNESGFNEGQDMATLTANAQSREFQAQNERVAGARHANQELASIRQPNLIGAGLQIAGAGLNAGATYYDQKSRMPTNKAG